MDKTTMAKDPRGFMAEIRNRVGPAKLWQDDDLQQVFWLGVVRGTQKVKWDRDPIPYLITRGFGEVRNYLSSQRLRSVIKRCVECGSENSYRKSRCECGGELVLENRMAQFVQHTTEDVDPLDALEVEQFVGTLSGRMGFVARRWLMERADLYYDNHLKQIGSELGISAVAVSHYKDRIRESFRIWRRG